VYCHFRASLHRLLPLVQHLHCSYSDKTTHIALFVRSLEIPLLWMEMAQKWTNRCHTPSLLSGAFANSGLLLHPGQT